MLHFFLLAALAPALVAAPALPAMAGCSDVPAPGVYLRRCQLDGGDYRNVDMTGGNLRDASFKRAMMSGANLDQIDGRRVKFVSTDLAQTTFREANLAQADFTKAVLNDSVFAGAQLQRTKFFRANLQGADFTGATMSDTDFLQADLSGATWTDGKTICAEGSIGRCIPGGSNEAAQAGDSAG